MKKMCPISSRQVDERVVQLNAALTVLSVAFMFTPFKWIIWVLSVDFFIRGFLTPSYSFYSAVSRTILRPFNINPIMVNAGPKIFAAKIGFIFCCMIGVFSLLDLPEMRLATCLIFMVCAALEAVFRFCLACRLYPIIHKAKVR